jgi:hypothetical protein
MQWASFDHIWLCKTETNKMIPDYSAKWHKQSVLQFQWRKNSVGLNISFSYLARAEIAFLSLTLQFGSYKQSVLQLRCYLVRKIFQWKHAWKTNGLWTQKHRILWIKGVKGKQAFRHAHKANNWIYNKK